MATRRLRRLLARLRWGRAARRILDLEDGAEQLRRRAARRRANAANARERAELQRGRLEGLDDTHPEVPSLREDIRKAQEEAADHAKEADKAEDLARKMDTDTQRLKEGRETVHDKDYADELTPDGETPPGK